MAKAMVMNWIEGKEIETDLEQYTGLRIGGRCQRTKNNIAMFHPSQDEKAFTGTVHGLEYQGTNAIGANVVVADIAWDDGKRLPCTTNFLKVAHH